VKGKNGDVYRVIPDFVGALFVYLYQYFEAGGPSRDGVGVDRQMELGDLVIRIRKYRNEFYVLHPAYGFGWVVNDSVELAQEQ